MHPNSYIGNSISSNTPFQVKTEKLSPDLRISYTHKSEAKVLREYLPIIKYLKESAFTTDTSDEGTGQHLDLVQLRRHHFKEELSEEADAALVEIWKKNTIRQIKQIPLGYEAFQHDPILHGNIARRGAQEALRLFKEGKRSVSESDEEGLKIAFSEKGMTPKSRRNLHPKRQIKQNKEIALAIREATLGLIRFARDTRTPIEEADYKSVKKYFKKKAEAAKEALFKELEQEEGSVAKTGKIQKNIGKKKRKKKPQPKKQEQIRETSSHTTSLSKSIAPNPLLRALMGRTGKKWKIHEHIARWKNATPQLVRQFYDRPSIGQKPYAEMSDQELWYQIHSHFFPGVERLLEAPLQHRYSYPYQYRDEKGEVRQGIGMYAELTANGETKSGVLTIGATKKGTLYHMWFKSFSGVPSGADLTTSLELPANGGSKQLEEAGWKAVDAYSVDIEQGDSVIFTYDRGEGRTATLRIYPLD